MRGRPRRAAPRRTGIGLPFIAAGVFLVGNVASAHPLVENSFDVVVGPNRIVIDAKISMEELLTVATTNGKAPNESELQAAVKTHGEYLLKHVRIQADEKTIRGTARHIPPPSPERPAENADKSPGTASDMVAYQLEFLLAAPPKVVALEQDLLAEYDGWMATCILRIRQSDRDAFDFSLLWPNKPAIFDCVWPDDVVNPPNESAPAGNDRGDRKELRTNVDGWKTFGEFAWHGILHILTGYDHLLFVAGLVLAATRFWDLVKVVTAFTLAHSLTLALSVFNVVTLPSRIVEPIIAASIVFVALQNIVSPKRASGWTRLATAFAFGLFHGLGFAGGLKDAMIEMPPAALWLALIAFSVGVEIGHQVVIVPLFAALFTGRSLTRSSEFASGRFEAILRGGSLLIALAGVHYLWQALGA